GELRLPRVAHDGAVALPVGAVSDQLLVPDADPQPAELLGREDGDHRPDPPAVGGEPEVIDQSGEDLLRALEVAAIADDQRGPVLAAHAAGAVAPGDARPGRQ